MQPIVAKRHFFKTGTQRIYQRFCLVLSNVKKTVEDIIQLDISNVSAGAFVFMCKSTEDTKKEFEEKLNELSKIKFPKAIIIGSSETYLEFFNYALEIASLKRVKTSVTAIEGDAVAKKELSAKLTSCQNLLFNSLYINFEKADWKFNNKKINTKNLSSIASDVSAIVEAENGSTSIPAMSFLFLYFLRESGLLNSYFSIFIKVDNFIEFSSEKLKDCAKIDLP